MYIVTFKEERSYDNNKILNINMGYSYWDSFENNSRSNVINSLHNALQKPNCASTDHLEHIIDNG